MSTRGAFERAAAIALLAAVAIAAHAKDGGNATDSVNPYSPRHGHPYRHGVVPTREAHANMKAWAHANHPAHPSVSAGKIEGPAAAQATTAATTGSGTLSFNGGIAGVGVTSGAPKVYLVFWGTQWGTSSTDANGSLHFTGDPKGAAPYMQAWLQGLGTNNELWSGVMTQYCDGSGVATGATACPSTAPHVGYPSGGVLAGVWYDNAAAAPGSATGAQLASEAVRAAGHFGNTTAASNRYVQYVIMSPTQTHPDGFNTTGGNFCAWHDFNGDTSLSGGAVSSPYGDVAFTNMPYVADMGTSCGQNFVSSALDGFSLVGGHEYAETITDQFPAGGWVNNTGSTMNGEENGDECAWISSGQGASALVAMATGSFAMQSTWSNDTNRCDLTHAIVTGGSGGQPTANFSVSVAALTASFTDTSTDSGGTIGSHAWTFGDGASSTATSPSHTYAAAGSYSVTETVKDSVSGAASSKSATVTVSSGGGTPIANFTVATNGLTATFTDTSTDQGGTIATHSWNFGDGATSTATNPSHSYAAAGTYSVTETVTDSVSGQSNAATAAVTVSGGSTQLLGNSGFETGSAAPWTMSAGVLCSNSSCAGESANTGSWFAWLDGYGATHTDTVSQPVAIPSGRKAKLAFALHIDTQERGTKAYDRLKVQVVKASGSVTTLATYSNVNAAPGYAVKTFDVSAFAGQTVTIRFVGSEDSSLATSFLVDDVTLTLQ